MGRADVRKDLPLVFTLAFEGEESKDWANVLSVSSSSKKTKRTLIKTQLIMKDVSCKNLLSFDEL